MYGFCLFIEVLGIHPGHHLNVSINSPAFFFLRHWMLCLCSLCIIHFTGSVARCQGLHCPLWLCLHVSDNDERKMMVHLSPPICPQWSSNIPPCDLVQLCTSDVDVQNRTVQWTPMSGLLRIQRPWSLVKVKGQALLTTKTGFPI